MQTSGLCPLMFFHSWLRALNPVLSDSTPAMALNTAQSDLNSVESWFVEPNYESWQPRPKLKKIGIFCHFWTAAPPYPKFVSSVALPLPVYHLNFHQNRLTGVWTLARPSETWAKTAKTIDFCRFIAVFSTAASKHLFAPWQNSNHL